MRELHGGLGEWLHGAKVEEKEREVLTQELREEKGRGGMREKERA